MKLRAPAVPLITVDPYFSVWSPDTNLNYAKTMHWTGKSNHISGVVTVDGVEYSFLGYHRNDHKLRQVSLDIDALFTTAVFENEAISLKAVFSTPVLPDDYRLLTRPVSYMQVTYTALDGAKHDVSVKVSASEELCLDKAFQSPVEAKEVSVAALRGASMGNTVQNPLNRSGDDLRIDWGYFYLMCDLSDATVTITPNGYHKQTYISVGGSMQENVPAMYLFAYDDCNQSIEYFGKPLTSYWNKDGQTILEAIAEAAADYEENLPRCKAFCQKLWDDAVAAGGEKYAEILSLAYRQVIAGHKLAIDENGEIIYVSKECFSNGCAVTVDVSYPSIPMFLLYNPELVKGMMRPIYKFAASKAWGYDFAPHDVGRYPLVNGQVYGLDKATGKLLFEKQMPVEECGNMIIMEAAVAVATRDTSFANEHMDVLEQWVNYLIENGEDPENQLCTDDFAGHLAHNCNLSLKAIMGITSMGILYKMNGMQREGRKYFTVARNLAKGWAERASNGDGSYRLAFDKPGTFSMKYNIVWDKLFGTEIMAREVIASEVASNKKHFHPYGMPLDNRMPYTKSDWLVWTATLCERKEDFEEFVAPMWQAFNLTPGRVPMTDWYYTITSLDKTYKSSSKPNGLKSFRNRTVQGGLFIKLLEHSGIMKFNG